MVAEPGMGARKWLDRWGVGGSSQHMGPRGREESGPGGGGGTGLRRRTPARGHALRWGCERDGAGGGHPSEVGAGEWGRPWMRWPRACGKRRRPEPCMRAPPDGASCVRHSFHFLLNVQQTPGLRASLKRATGLRSPLWGAEPRILQLREQRPIKSQSPRWLESGSQLVHPFGQH